MSTLVLAALAFVITYALTILAEMMIFELIKILDWLVNLSRPPPTADPNRLCYVPKNNGGRSGQGFSV
jgi:hypothetical protein